MQTNRHRHNDTVETAPENDADHAPDDAALSDDGLADDQARKRDRHHARPDIDIARILVLRQKTARKAGQGIGHAEAHRNRKGRIDARRLHHRRIIAGRTDGKAEPCVQKPREKQRHEQNDDQDHDHLIPIAADRSFCDAENRIAVKNIDDRGKLHHHDVDRIKPRVDNDAGKNGLYAHPRLQKSRHKARERPGRKRREQRKERMSGKRYHRADGAA